MIYNAVDVVRELVDLYPVQGEGIKPQKAPGMSYESRMATLESLIDYYHPDSESFDGRIGSLEDGLKHDTFRGIADFLKMLKPSPRIDEARLQDYFRGLAESPDEQLVSRFEQVLGFLSTYEQLMPTWRTCLYKQVEAIGVSAMTIQEKDGVSTETYVYGAVGTSGGHEDLYMSSQQSQGFLEEVVVEALVVRGFPFREIGEVKLAREVTQVARQLLKKRKQDFPFAWAPNCKDLSQLANDGVDILAEEHGVAVRPADTYKTCLMGKFNWQYAGQFEQAGLPQRAEFGRLRCPSDCAEAQALMRGIFWAPLIPLTLGVKESFLVAVGGAEARDPRKRLSLPTACVELSYMVPVGGLQGFDFRRLLIDLRLSAERMKPEAEHPWLSYLWPRLRETGINPDNYHLMAVVYDGETKEVVVNGGVVSSDAPGTTYTAGGIELLRVPLTEVQRLPVIKSAMGQMWSSTVPCLHCLNMFDRFGVKALHIDEMTWGEALDGEDGLAREWLMESYRGDLTVGSHVFKE